MFLFVLQKHYRGSYQQKATESITNAKYFRITFHRKTSTSSSLIMHSTSNLGNILKEKEKKDFHYLRSPYIPSFNFRAEPSTNENI